MQRRPRFSYDYMKLHLHVNRYPSHFVNPLPQPCYCSTIPHVVEAWQCFVFTVVAVRIIFSMGRLLLLCTSKKQHITFSVPPQSLNDHSWNTVGQDEKF